MGKKRKPPATPQRPPVDALEMYAVAYRDGRELSQAPSDRLEAVRDAVALGDWERAIIAAFDLGEWCAGAEALPAVLKSMQTELDLIPFENKARRQETARQDKLRKRSAATNAEVLGAFNKLTPEQQKSPHAVSLIEKATGQSNRNIRKHLAAAGLSAKKRKAGES